MGIPELLLGEVDLPQGAPADTAKEDAIIGTVGEELADPNEPFAVEQEALDYFNSVTEEEALNYLMFLHDTHHISFDRLNELKVLLESVPSFLPGGD